MLYRTLTCFKNIFVKVLILIKRLIKFIFRALIIFLKVVFLIIYVYYIYSIFEANGGEFVEQMSCSFLKRNLNLEVYDLGPAVIYTNAFMYFYRSFRVTFFKSAKLTHVNVRNYLVLKKYVKYKNNDLLPRLFITNKYQLMLYNFLTLPLDLLTVYVWYPLCSKKSYNIFTL